MGQEEVAVKRRQYQSDLRRQRADRSRSQIVASARALFLRDGYAATTVGAIADGASVSVETIYKSFGGKAGLARAVWESGLAGRGPVPAEDRSDAIRDASDPASVIDAWGRLTAEVAPRTAPILLLLRSAAATDPDAAALFAEAEADRLTRMTDNARHLHRSGNLRPGISVKEVADVLYVASSPDLFDVLVVRRRWSARRYAAFVATTMKGALLPEVATPRSSPRQ